MNDHTKTFIVGLIIGMTVGAVLVGVYLGKTSIIGVAGVFLLVALMIEDTVFK